MAKEYIWLAWDALAVIVLIWCVYLGTKKGFLRSVLSAVSYILAVTFANLLSPKVAAWAYTTVVEPPLQDMAINAVNQALEQGVQNTGDLLSGMPAWVRQYLEPFMADTAGSLDALQNNAQTAVLQAIDTAVREPITWFIAALLFVIFFVVFAFLFRQVSRLFHGVNRIPLIGTVNMALGGLIGIAQAGAWLFFVSVVLSLFVTLTGDRLWWLNHQTLRQTYILGIFYRLLG